MSRRTWWAVAVCGSAFALGNAGCLCCGPGYDTQRELCNRETCESVNGRPRDHVFIVGGYNPLASDDVEAVRDWLIRRGYNKVYSGTAYNTGTFATTIAEVRTAQPGAKIIVIGVGGGASVAEQLAAKVGGADLIVTLGPDAVGNESLLAIQVPVREASGPPAWHEPLRSALVSTQSPPPAEPSGSIAFDPAPTPRPRDYTTAKRDVGPDPLRPLAQLPEPGVSRPQVAARQP